jgi:hypothetical protein
MGDKEPVIAVFVGTLPKTAHGNSYDTILFMHNVLVVSYLHASALIIWSCLSPIPLRAFS